MRTLIVTLAILAIAYAEAPVNNNNNNNHPADKDKRGAVTPVSVQPTVQTVNQVSAQPIQYVQQTPVAATYAAQPAAVSVHPQQAYYPQQHYVQQAVVPQQYYAQYQPATIALPAHMAAYITQQAAAIHPQFYAHQAYAHPGAYATYAAVPHQQVALNYPQQAYYNPQQAALLQQAYYSQAQPVVRAQQYNSQQYNSQQYNSQHGQVSAQQPIRSSGGAQYNHRQN